jgi:hypothetical protein
MLTPRNKERAYMKTEPQTFLWIRITRLVGSIRSDSTQKIYASPEFVKSMSRGPVIESEAVQYVVAVAAEAFPGWEVYGIFTYQPGERKNG